MKIKAQYLTPFIFSTLISFAADAPPAAPAPGADAAKAPAAAAAPATGKEPEFKGEALVIKKKLEELFETSKKVNSEGATKAKARADIEGALDWDKVSELCLGKENYKKNAGKNFGEFRDLLKQVIIKTAFTRLDKFWTDTTYKIDSIDVKGNDAKVSARFFVKNEPFSLDYYFLKKNGKWSVYDISYEELRYSVNINEQIDAFLKEKSFPGLLEKLKKRRAELDENSKKG